MSESNYKQLNVWIRSVDFVTTIYGITGSFPDTEKFNLVSQIRRSAVSIPSNIAEGSKQDTKKDFRNFINIALGSAAELETQLLVSENLRFIDHVRANELKEDLLVIIKMLYKLKKSLEPPTTNHQPPTKKGFTLMELLLVIALIAIVSGLTIPILLNYQKKAILQSDTFAIVESIRRAQTLARSSAEDDAWSARIDGSSLVVYKGTNYAARDISFDEPTSISTSLVTSGITEFNFEKITGTTIDVGALIVANDTEQKGISVNEKGLVTY